MKSTIGGSVAGEATSLPTRPMVGALMVNLVMAMTIGSRFSGDRTSYGSFQASKRLRGLIHRSSALEHPGQSNAANAQVSSCEGFLTPAPTTPATRADKQASEKRQGTKSRAVGHPPFQRALWGLCPATVATCGGRGPREREVGRLRWGWRVRSALDLAGIWAAGRGDVGD